MGRIEEGLTDAMAHEEARRCLLGDRPGAGPHGGVWLDRA